MKAINKRVLRFINYLSRGGLSRMEGEFAVIYKHVNFFTGMRVRTELYDSFTSSRNMREEVIEMLSDEINTE